MLHGSETWLMKKETRCIQWAGAEMRMIRWMCGTAENDRFLCNKLRHRVQTDNIITVLQRNRLRWYDHISRQGEKMHRLWSGGPIGRPKKTGGKVVEKVCWTQKIK